MHDNLLDLGEFLEELLQRKVDLVSEEWMSKRFRASVMPEAVFLSTKKDRGVVV